MRNDRFDEIVYGQLRIQIIAYVQLYNKKVDYRKGNWLCNTSDLYGALIPRERDFEKEIETSSCPPCRLMLELIPHLLLGHSSHYIL